MNNRPRSFTNPRGRGKQEGQKMRTNNDILTEAKNLRAKADELEAIVRERNKYGDDPFKNGTVLKVDMKYRSGSRSYAYAVIKVGGRFYLSGKMGAVSNDALNIGSGMTWDNFVAWLAQGDATVWQATGLKQVL